MRRRLLCAALGLAAGTFAARVEASPSAKLVYVRGAGAESCPGEAEMRSAVARRLGYDPFFPVAAKTVVTPLAHTAAGYRAHVQIVSEDGKVRGERDLAASGDDCAELLAALALAVSIAIDDLDDERTAASTSAAPETRKAETPRAEERPTENP